MANGNLSTESLRVSSQFGTDYASQQVTGWSTSGYNFVFTPGTADTTGAVGQDGKLYLSVRETVAATASPPVRQAETSWLLTVVFTSAPSHKPLAVSRPANTLMCRSTMPQHSSMGLTAPPQSNSKLASEARRTQRQVLSIASHGFSGWQHETLTFKATSSSEVLSFLGERSPCPTAVCAPKMESRCPPSPSRPWVLLFARRLLQLGCHRLCTPEIAAAVAVLFSKLG